MWLAIGILLAIALAVYWPGNIFQARFVCTTCGGKFLSCDITPVADFGDGRTYICDDCQATAEAIVPRSRPDL